MFRMAAAMLLDFLFPPRGGKTAAFWCETSLQEVATVRVVSLPDASSLKQRSLMWLL